MRASLSFSRALWMIPIQIALHSLEEAVTMPRWASEYLPALHGRFPFRLSVEASFHETLVKLLIVTLVPSLLAYLCACGGGKSLRVYVLLGLQGVVAIDAMVGNIVGVLRAHTYVPGAATAAAICLPFSAYLVRRALRDGYADGRTLVVVFAIAAILYMPGTFALGGLAHVVGKAL